MTLATANSIESLQFDEASHHYTLNGRVIPSVTQVINSVVPGWQADEWYMQRGTAMHHGCRLMDEGLLDWSSVAPEIEGRLRAWEKFRAEFPARVLYSERKFSHPTYGFAGTIDRFFEGAIIADIKSTICPQVKLQLGGYSLLLNSISTRSSKNMCAGVAVELRDDASYRTEWFTAKQVEEGSRIFLACLTVHNFKAKECIK